MKGGLRAAPAVGVTPAVSSRTGSLTGPPDERAELVRVPGPAVTGTGEISGEDLARVQAQAIDRLMPSPANRANPATGVSLGSARPKTAE